MKKGEDGMQGALDRNKVALKLNILKKNASDIKNDISLRHVPNEHDIAICSENTALLHVHQQDTIYKGE